MWQASPIAIFKVKLDGCQVSFLYGVVQGRRVRIEQKEQRAAVPPPTRRGDRQRQAIVQAVRELLEEKPFAQLSVSTISDRAGVARSGFYFYFDSKYAVLAVILADASELLDELTHHFAPREPGETPEAFAKRMVGSAAAVYANDDPVLSACAVARNTDAQIREMMDDFYDSVIDKLIALLEQTQSLTNDFARGVIKPARQLLLHQPFKFRSQRYVHS